MSIFLRKYAVHCCASYCPSYIVFAVAVPFDKLRTGRRRLNSEPKSQFVPLTIQVSIMQAEYALDLDR